MKFSVLVTVFIAYFSTVTSAYPVSKSLDLTERDVGPIASLIIARSLERLEGDISARGFLDIVKKIRKDTPEEKAHQKEFKAQVNASKKFQKAAGKVISAQAKKEMGADYKKAGISMTWQSYKGSGGEYERRAKKHLEELVKKDWLSKKNQQGARHADLSIQVLPSGTIMGQVRYNNAPNAVPQSSNTFTW